MKQDLIKDVIQGMLPYLNNAQNEKLQEVLKYTFANYEVTENQSKEKYSEQNYVELFLSAKRIEGCSEKSLKYYKATIEAMLCELKKRCQTHSYRRHQRIPNGISGKRKNQARLRLTISVVFSPASSLG